ncbi:hypothetical protein [Streptomyces gardneri]|uniref:Alpha/beta hydrolase n=1 Tax=Streptomyces gardneri TaxID=66892 RepID=A0A4Y3RQ93_9ACTN|nr:hypothetical protein [Streptomyces gardneri]GEB60071.1 hypothetical protein SGA01_56760 [Streptomyces gardneri]GHH21121.1 hypothetical protein GCM10017674_75550 [Streptomyces gardneri]
MCKLILVHGRSQQFKKAGGLKQQWKQALQSGLTKAGASLEMPDEQIRFPYYGDTLHHLTKSLPGDAPDVIIKGYGEPSEGEREFIAAVVAEVVKASGISEADIRAAAETPAIIEKGMQNWRWVIAALRVIDKMPGLSSASLELATRDVYAYMHNHGIQAVIEAGIRKAFTPDEKCVVVAHSLGTVIVYNMLKREAEARNWNVPTLITLGSPLAVGPIVEALRPIGRPYGVVDWFNAFDPRDVVALHPLDYKHFPVDPVVENFSGIRNETPNRHGIAGYLDNSVVALRVRDALSRL